MSCFISCPADRGVVCLPGSARWSGRSIGVGQSVFQPAARTMVRGGWSASVGFIWSSETWTGKTGQISEIFWYGLLLRPSHSSGHKFGPMGRYIGGSLIGASFACPDWRGDRDVGSGWVNRPSNPQPRTDGRRGAVKLHRVRLSIIALRNLNGQILWQISETFMVWPAPDSLIPCFLGISPRLAIERFLKAVEIFMMI